MIIWLSKNNYIVVYVNNSLNRNNYFVKDINKSLNI